MTRPSAEQRRQVVERAHGCCEYCLLHESQTFAAHEVDHIVAEKHGGETTLDNLAFSCFLCNRRKASDLASLDPQTGELQPLFHPRDQMWHEHFELRGSELAGLTAVGRTTAHFLQLNSEERLIERTAYIATGAFPPKPKTRKPK